MSEAAFLLDTNILVYLLDGRGDLAQRRIESHPPGVVVTSSLCVAEALFGLPDDRLVLATFERLLAVVPPIPFDLAAARAFPSVPFRRGRLDRLIAAHCLSRGLILVTHNEADFDDVPGLRVEDWVRN